jgi:hypothetical protein
MDAANPQVMNEEHQTPEMDCNIPSQISATRGGRTCCVPNCNNNSRCRADLSYHKIPQEPTLRKKWTKVLKIKGFCNPGTHNYVCSVHFSGGKKTYENNIPKFLSSETHQPTKRRNVSIVNDVTTSRNEPEPDSIQTYQPTKQGNVSIVNDVTTSSNEPEPDSLQTHQPTKQGNVSIVNDVATSSNEPEPDSLQTHQPTKQGNVSIVNDVTIRVAMSLNQIVYRHTNLPNKEMFPLLMM